MTERNKHKGLTGFTRIFNALRYSVHGFRAAWQDEEAFRQIIFLSMLGVPCALYFGEDFTEKMLLLLPCVLCILVELLNSAIENVVDRISLDSHELSKKAKDMGSAAQLSAQIFLYATWVVYVLCNW